MNDVKGYKVLISGNASTGKSTILSEITDKILVLNLDEKPYTYKVNGAVATLDKYNNQKNLIDWINQKVIAYKNKFGELPQVIAFDTVTRLYSSIEYANRMNYKGFETHMQNKDATYLINWFINQLLAKGINVIALAHSQVEEGTGRIFIPAQGAFKNSGGWLSLFDNAIYLTSIKKEKYVVVNSPTQQYPARQAGSKEELMVPQKEFDINEYLNNLKNIQINMSQQEI